MLLWYVDTALDTSSAACIVFAGSTVLMRWLESSCTNITSTAKLFDCSGCSLTVSQSSPSGACYLMLNYPYVVSDGRTTHTSDYACGTKDTSFFQSAIDTHHPSASGKIWDLKISCGSTVFDHQCLVCALR